MRPTDIHTVVDLLETAILQWKEPVVGVVARKRDPFRVLIATILSLRTKDETTSKAAQRLFEKADSPETLGKMDTATIAGLIYPVGFYRNKAETIQIVSRDIIDRFGGAVPDDIDDLLTLKGVGRKTANLVVTLGFNKPGICVDIHVHRITNRWGYVKTKTPDETETALRKKLPGKYWIRINDLLVPYGQNLCRPVSPFCSRCTIAEYCRRIGVDRSR